jgi:hypothetical protein
VGIGDSWDEYEILLKLGLKILDFSNKLYYTVGNCVIKWVEVGALDIPALLAKKE